MKVRPVVRLADYLCLQSGYESLAAALDPCHRPSRGGVRRCLRLVNHDGPHRFAGDVQRGQSSAHVTWQEWDAE